MHPARITTSLNLAATFCALAALVLYTATLAPTFSWGDSADLAMRMVDASDPTFVGSTRDYVLYRSVGSLFQMLPFGDAGTRANFMAAFFGAVTIGMVAWMAGYLARSIFAAYAAAIALTLSHTFWLMSVIAEVYTFNATLIFLAYALLALWWRNGQCAYLVGAVLGAGLCLTHHASGLVVAATLVPPVLLRIRTIRPHTIALLCALFFTASLPYWQHVMVQLNAARPLLKALGLQTPANPFFDVAPLRESIKFLAYTAYNYLGLALPLALFGGTLAVRQRMGEMLAPALWLGLMFGAGITASIPDKFNIYVLIYPVLAIAIGLGAAEVNRRFLPGVRAQAALLVLLAITPPLGYLAAIAGAQQLGIDLVGARPMPYRDNARYFMWPPKQGDIGPRRYAEEALHGLAPGAVLLADYSLWRPIYFMQQIEHQRPDVQTLWVEPLTWNGGNVRQFVETLPCKRPVYLASNQPPEYYELADLAAHYKIEQNGLTFRLTQRCKNK